MITARLQRFYRYWHELQKAGTVSGVNGAEAGMLEAYESWLVNIDSVSPSPTTTEDQTRKLGDQFRDLVLTRTGLKPTELVCPREKSDMTPCTARDGGITVILINGHPCCVGCETRIDLQVAKELAKVGVNPDRPTIAVKPE